MNRRGVLAMAGVLVGCGVEAGGRATPTVPPAAEAQGRLVAENRRLTQALRDAEAEATRLRRELRLARAEAAAAKGRVADRTREAESLRAVAAAPAGPPVDGTGETATAFAERFLREMPGTNTDPGASDLVDWPSLVASALAGADAEGAAPVLSPEGAAATFAALPEGEREAALVRTREWWRGLVDGPTGLRALHARPGAWYLLGTMVRVELVGTGADGEEVRYTATLAAPTGRWQMVRLARA